MGASVTGLVAFALFLAGGLLLWANGHYKDADGFLTTPNQRFESDSYAITTQNLEVGAGAPGFLLKADRYGTIRLETMAKGGKPLFVGVARTRDVDAYLKRLGAQRRLRHRLRALPRPLRPARRRPPARPARRGSRSGPPAASTRSAGTCESGDWSVVVMNADGSRGVAAAVSAGAKVPYIAEIAYVTLGFGLLFVIATTALTMYGTRPVVRKLAIA